MNAFAKTKLVADTSIGFPDKNLLKKREGGRVIPLYVRYAFVASVAAGLMLIIFMRGVPWHTSDIHSPVAKESPSSPSLQPSHDRDTNTNEIERQSSPGNSDLASNQISNSPEKNAADKDNHKNNSDRENPLSLAHAAPAVDSTNSLLASNDVQVTGDMTKIGGEVAPINFQPRMKKASYREIPEAFPDKNTVAENKSTMKFSSVASVLGNELLRLTGREDYLKSTSAFNETAVTKKKLPLALSIKGGKFNFYHKFFKKRSSSESKKTKP